jgi:lysophospholipase L1-like esterase
MDHHRKPLLHIIAALLGHIFIHNALQATDPGRYAKAIDGWTAQDEKNPPAPGGALFIGSSSVRMWKSLQADFPELATLNRGFGGSWTQDVLHYYDRIVRPYKPAKIIFYCGENDLAGGEATNVPVENFRTFVDWARKDNPCVKIYFIPIKPSPSRWKLWPKFSEANEAIEGYCKENKVHYLHNIPQKMLTKAGKPDEGIFTKDNLHMNARGYKIWTAEVRKAIGLKMEE